MTRSTGARVLIVGLDGATFSIVDHLIAEGRLPNLQTLIRTGVRAPMNSTIPPVTLPAWSSFITGCNPGKHGIFDFVRRVPGRYDLEFANATHRPVPTLFRWLSDRGARVASIAVPTTYPPETLNGVVISGFDSPVAIGIDGSFVTPASLYATLQQQFGGMSFADFQELDLGPGWHEAALTSLFQEISRKQAIGTWLLGQERFDAFMLLFGETDTVAHHFWMFHDENSPRHPRGCPKRLRDAVANVYIRCDQALGQLIEKADPELVVIASDHGFGGASDQILYINRFLESRGWWLGNHENVGPGHRSGSGVVDWAKGKALRHFPARVQQQIVRRMPQRWLGAVESSSRYGGIDFSGTRAWSDEMNYASTIHLNIAGRDPKGTILDVETAICELQYDLLNWRIDEKPVVRQVWRREELFHGSMVEYAPDLVLDLHEIDGYTWNVLPSARSPRGQLHRRMTPAEHVGGKGLGPNGSHRQHGVLILSGRGIKTSTTIEADIIDPAPTILGWLGEAIPDHIDGRVLQSAFVEPQRVTWTFAGMEAATQRHLDSSEAYAVRQRLEALGYW